MNLRMPILAGVFVRGKVRLTLERIAFESGTRYTLEERKTWLQSLFLLSICGGYDETKALQRKIHAALGDCVQVEQLDT